MVRAQEIGEVDLTTGQAEIRQTCVVDLWARRIPRGVKGHPPGDR